MREAAQKEYPFRAERGHIGAACLRVPDHFPWISVSEAKRFTLVHIGDEKQGAVRPAADGVARDVAVAAPHEYGESQRVPVEILARQDAEIILINPDGGLVVDFFHDMIAGHFRDDKFAAQRLPAEVTARVDVKLGTRVSDCQESLFQHLSLCEYASGRVFRRICAAPEDYDVFVQGRKIVEERLEVERVQRSDNADGREIFDAFCASVESFPVLGERLGIGKDFKLHRARPEDGERNDGRVDIDAAVPDDVGRHAARDDGLRESVAKPLRESKNRCGFHGSRKNSDQKARVLFRRVRAKLFDTDGNVIRAADNVRKLLHENRPPARNLFPKYYITNRRGIVYIQKIRSRRLIPTSGNGF